MLGGNDQRADQILPRLPSKLLKRAAPDLPRRNAMR